MDGIKHKPDCFPGARTHEVVSPVIGHRCRNCGEESPSVGEFEKWKWMMDYCKRNSLAPASESSWKWAKKAYAEAHKGQ